MSAQNTDNAKGEVLVDMFPNLEDRSLEILEGLMDLRREGAEKAQAIVPPEDEGESESWVGHDMSTKTSETGLRVATLNTQKKFFANELNWETIAEVMKEKAIDIMVITEAGKADEMRIAALKNWAGNQSMSAEVINRSNISISGGMVVLTASGLAGIKRTIHRFQPEKGDRDRAVAIEYNNGIEGDHNKVMIMGYYGYNASQTMKEKVTELHKWIWKTKSKFKRDSWQAPTILMGDFNAAVSSRYDTDREGTTEEQTETDATTIEHLESLGFHDPLRQDYPLKRLTTRRRNHEGNQTMRYLDRILMSSEMSSHFSTRVGIYQQAIFGIEDTDHKMVVADIPIDIAGTAVKRARIWDVHKRTLMKWDGDEVGNMDPEKVAEYNKKAKESIPEDSGPSGITKWLKEAGKGSVLKEVVQEFPRKVRKLKDFQSIDWSMRRNAKIIREALRLIGQGIHPGEALRGTRNLKDIQGTPHEDIKYKCVWDPSENRITIVNRLEEIMEVTREYSNRENRKQRASQIKDNIEKRNRRFKDPNKKTLKAVITSIMRRARLSEQILVQTRGDGKGVATEAPEVAKEVVKFYREWMKSRVPWEQRWKSWKGMMELDKDQLVDDEYSEFVEEAYRDSFDKYGQMQREDGIWDEVWEEVSMDDMQKALRKFKSGKAGGPSGITYDLLKALEEENSGPILELMRQCLKDRALPKELNRSMIRALAKTEQGVADLNMTRPIALMEALGKLFERILFMRIVKVLSKHNMIDLSQHGGMAHRSSADPIRILAEVMEDAEQSGQEFHLFSADLSKAFDSLEFWSQAMSWRALGMPEEMAMMLMNLDEMAESEVILGQGRTTSEVLGEEGWFTSGRGVRQGSIGGPIKWIVYMNFWLKYVDKKREGEGYRMSKDPSTVLRSQMFVDDSNWAARTVKGMNNMIQSGDTFVGFHGLAFNKKKSEYVVMNQKMEVEGTWERPKWPGGQELVETIRVVGTMEDTRKARSETATEKANKILYSATSGAHAEEVRARPSEFWKKLQMRADEEAKKWQVKNEEMWWAGEGTNNDLGGMYEAVREARGKGTWRPMTDNAEIELEAESIVHRWVEVQEGIQRMQVRSDTAMRYLGVWFEAGGKWIRQRRILDSKFREANDRISRSSPTRDQAVYCINATINAALKFPLQVANVPKSMLEEWDRKNRTVVRSAGYLPRSTPVELIHLPKEEGGLGLESLKEAVGRTQIGRYMTMLNTDDRSLAARMVRAGRARFREHGSRGPSIHGRMVSDLEDRGMEITEAVEQEDGQIHHRFDWFGEQLQEDKEWAHSIPITGGTWEAYGDGATYSQENRAGWGMWAVNGDEHRVDRGRLQGEQLNDGAEAMAILETLKGTNPKDDLEIYCDNSSCVSKWNKLKEGDTYAMEWGYRAIWNRIQGLLSVRNDSGARTSMRWVHSHVDDERRRTSKNSKLTCACREEGKTECDPTHRHHIGNEKADAAAREGAGEPGGDDWGEAARGEMWFLIRDRAGFAQGSYKEWLKKRATEDLLEWGEAESDEVAPPKWAQAVRAADRKIMLSVLRKLDTKGAVSWRFWSRVICQTLPTYARMVKFANTSDQNSYREVYGDHVGPRGRCASCGHEEETVEHALVTCPAVGKIWHDANENIAWRWEQEGLEWRDWSWLERNNRWVDWSPLWATSGLVPRRAQMVLQGEAGIGHIAAFTLLRDTAKEVLQASHEAWKWRVEATQAWEKRNEVMHATKTEMNRTVWAKGAIKTKKQRVDGESARAAREKKEREAKCKERASQWQRKIQQRTDEERHEKGRVPMSANMAERLIERAQTCAVKKMRLDTRRARTLARNAVGTNELNTVMESIAETQRKAPRQVDLPRQEGQMGLWFPSVGTEVETLKRRRDGSTAWETGRTTALEWQEKELPRVCVEYAGGVSQWHDIASEAGTCVRLKAGGGTETLVMVPANMRELLGHGTELLITWLNNRKVTKWHGGRIVAIDEEKWAIRYEGGLTASVAWHDLGDLESRGLIVVTARRKGEYTNESYQALNHNRITGCLLLTDEGECACEICVEKGWPMEIAEAGEELNQGTPLQSMGPIEGRKELNRRREEKRKRETKERTKQNNRNKIQRHKETQEQLKKKHTDPARNPTQSAERQDREDGEHTTVCGHPAPGSLENPEKGEGSNPRQENIGNSGSNAARSSSREHDTAEGRERTVSNRRLEPESRENPEPGSDNNPQQGSGGRGGRRRRCRPGVSEPDESSIGKCEAEGDGLSAVDERLGPAYQRNRKQGRGNLPERGNGEPEHSDGNPRSRPTEGSRGTADDQRTTGNDRTVGNGTPKPGYGESPRQGDEEFPQPGSEEPNGICRPNGNITAEEGMYSRRSTREGKRAETTEDDKTVRCAEPGPGPSGFGDMGNDHMPQMGDQGIPNMGDGDDGTRRSTEGRAREIQGRGGKSNRRPREESHREPGRQDKRHPKAPYQDSDKEQGRREDDRMRERGQSMGMVRESDQKQCDNNETQGVANTTRTNGKRDQIRCGVGRAMDLQEENDCASEQRGGVGSNQNMDLIPRRTPEGGTHDTETREERSPQIRQIELVQKDRGSGSHVRDNSIDDLRGGTDHRDGQGIRRGESRAHDVADTIDEVARSDGLDTRRHQRPAGGSRIGEAMLPEEGTEDEGRDRRHENHGCRGGLGINRDSSIPDPRMCDHRGGQSRVLRPGSAPWSGNEQDRYGPLLERVAEHTEEDSQESLEGTGDIRDDMVITGVQDSHGGQHDECDERMYERETIERPEECDGPRNTSGKGNAVPTMPGSYREPDGGIRPGDRENSFRGGEPSDERPLGPRIRKNENRKKRVMVSKDSRSVRIRQEVQKTDEDPDEPRQLEPKRDHRGREMQGGKVRRDDEQPRGPPPEQTRTDNDNIGPEEETEGREGNRSEGTEGIQRESGEEPCPSRTSDRDSGSRNIDIQRERGEQRNHTRAGTRKRKPNQQTEYDPNKRARRHDTRKSKRTPELGEGREDREEEEERHGVKEVRTMEDRLPPVKVLRKGEG